MFGMIDLGLQLLKILGVVGGGAIGWIGGGWLTQRGAAMARKQPSTAVKRGGQAVSGAGLAYLVMLWVYGTGGSGWGLGGGPGNGAGTGTGTGDSTAAAAPTTKTASARADEKDREKLATALPRTSILKIELLGGDKVTNKRFYLLEGEKEPRTLESIREYLTARMQPTSEQPVNTLYLILYSDSVAFNHSAVRDLQDWARNNHLTVSMRMEQGPRP